MQTSITSSPDIKPITVTVQEARRLLGLGNTTLWRLIAEEKLQTVRIGRRRLILFESLQELIATAAA